MEQEPLILVVEDEPEIREVLEAYLRRDRFRTAVAADGPSALRQHRTLAPDLVLLDAALPGLDGFEVLARIRRSGPTPVIMVTAMADDVDRISGLRLGADDYVVKPFNPAEVVARVKTVLRRTSATAEPVRLRHGPLEIDPAAYAASLLGPDGGRTPLPLTLTELRILTVLVRRPSHVFPREALVETCLREGEQLPRAIDAHVANLRRKLAAAGLAGVPQAVRGVGYRLAPP